MKIAYGDLFLLARSKVVCVTTNGDVTKAGKCVMGRGTALQAAKMYPWIPATLGKYLKDYGANVPYTLFPKGYLALITFPVKHHWREKADLDLIELSTKLLIQIADSFDYKEIFLPRPGCANGQLVWEEVAPILVPLLDDRFTVVDRHR